MFRRPGRGGKGFPNRGIRCLRNKSRPFAGRRRVVTDIDLIAPELWGQRGKSGCQCERRKRFCQRFWGYVS